MENKFKEPIKLQQKPSSDEIRKQSEALVNQVKYDANRVERLINQTEISDDQLELNEKFIKLIAKSRSHEIFDNYDNQGIKNKFEKLSETEQNNMIEICERKRFNSILKIIRPSPLNTSGAKLDTQGY